MVAFNYIFEMSLCVAFVFGTTQRVKIDLTKRGLSKNNLGCLMTHNCLIAHLKQAPADSVKKPPAQVLS